MLSLFYILLSPLYAVVFMFLNVMCFYLAPLRYVIDLILMILVLSFLFSPLCFLSLFEVSPLVYFLTLSIRVIAAYPRKLAQPPTTAYTMTHTGNINTITSPTVLSPFSSSLSNLNARALGERWRFVWVRLIAGWKLLPWPLLAFRRTAKLGNFWNQNVRNYIFIASSSL